MGQDRNLIVEENGLQFVEDNIAQIQYILYESPFLPLIKVRHWS